MTAKEFGQSMFQIGFLYGQVLFRMHEPYRTAALSTLDMLITELTKQLEGDNDADQHKDGHRRPD